MKGPESSFLTNQECMQHKVRKNHLGSEAEVSENAKGSRRRSCLKLLIKEVKTAFKECHGLSFVFSTKKGSSEDCKGGDGTTQLPWVCPFCIRRK